MSLQILFYIILLLKQVSAYAGTAMQFDGSTTFLSGFGSFDIGQSFTIEAWIQYGSSTSSQCIWNQALMNGKNVFAITEHSLSQNQYEVRYGEVPVTWRDWMDLNGWVFPDDGSREVRVSNAVHHFAVTHEVVSGTTANLTMYVNGSMYAYMEAPALDTSTISPLPLIAGACNELKLGQATRRRFFAGAIDEVRFWNTPRSSSQITATMGLGGDDLYTSADTSGLVAHYTFDELDQTTNVPDKSGNNRHANRGGGIITFAPEYVNSFVNLEVVGGKEYIGDIHNGDTIFLPSRNGGTGLSVSDVSSSTLSVVVVSGGVNITALPLAKDLIRNAGDFTFTDGSEIRKISIRIVQSSPPVAGNRYTVEFFGAAGLISTKQPLPLSVTIEFWTKLKAFTDSALMGLHTNGGSNRAYFGVWGRMSFYFCPEQQVVSLDDWNEGANPFHVGITYEYLGGTQYNVSLYKTSEGTGRVTLLMLNFIVEEACTLLNDSTTLLPLAFGQEYDGGPSYSDHANAYMTDFRIWDYAKTREEIEENAYSRLTGNEPGLQTYLPVTKGDMDRNDYKLKNFGYLSKFSNCTGYRNGKYHYNEDCDADIICNAGRCGFSRKTGHTIRLAPFLLNPDVWSMQTSVSKNVINQSIPIYDPDNIEQTSLSLTSRDDIIVQIQSIPDSTCGILFHSDTTSPISVGDVISDKLINFNPTGIKCDSSFTYRGIDVSMKYTGGGLVYSPTTSTVPIKVLDVGPVISSFNMGRRFVGAEKTTIVIRFNMETDGPETVGSDSDKISQVFSIVDGELVYEEAEWTSSGNAITFEGVSDTGVVGGTTTISIIQDQKILSGKIGGVLTHYSEMSATPLTLQGDSTSTLCAPGTFFMSNNAICSVCPAGQVPDSRNILCTECVAGTFSSAPGASKCDLCPVGTFTSLVGATGCLNCPVGTSAASPGSTDCESCRPGEYQSNTTSASCFVCPRGTYSFLPESSFCDVCPFFHSTTSSVATKSIYSCACAPGFFHRCDEQSGRCGARDNLMRALGLTNTSLTELDIILEIRRRSANLPSVAHLLGHSFCEPCSEGLNCNGYFSRESFVRGSEGIGNTHKQPDSAKLHSLRLTEPYRPYLCKGRNAFEICPGGPPGFCGHNFDPNSPACGRCMEDYYLDSGTCSRCEGKNVVGWVFFGIFIAVILYLVQKLFNREGSAAAVSTIQLTCATGITFNMLQSMSIIGSVDLDWSESFQNLFAGLNIFIFDFQVLKTECTFGYAFQGGYLSKTLIPLLLLGVFALTYPVKFTLDKFGLWKLNPNHINNLINFTGALVTALYITLAKTSFMVFECYDHPDGSSSVVARPDILCESTERKQMIGPGVIFILIYCVGIPLWFTWAIISAPSRLEDNDFRLRYRFLFNKFRPEKYYWSLAVLSRSLALALTTTLFPGDGYNQAVWMVFIFFLFGLVTTRVLPWKDKANNRMDVSLMFLLALIVLLSMRFIRQDDVSGETKSDSVVQGAIFALMFVIIVICGCTIGLQLYTFFYKKSDPNRRDTKKKMQNTQSLQRLIDCIVDIRDSPQRFKFMIDTLTPLDLDLLRSTAVRLEYGGVHQKKMTVRSSFQNISELRVSFDAVRYSLENRNGESKVSDSEAGATVSITPPN